MLLQLVLVEAHQVAAQVTAGRRQRQAGQRDAQNGVRDGEDLADLSLRRVRAVACRRPLVFFFRALLFKLLYA